MMRFVRRWLVAASYILVFLGSAQAQSVNIGETAVLGAADGDNGNLLLAQVAMLSKAATVQSLSFYVTAASGNLILGIYDATGPSGGPGALKASTKSFAPTKGWNTAKVVTPVSLAAGTYWLAYLPSSNGLGFVKTNATGNCKYYSVSFGSLPSNFSTSPASCNPTTWSFYATLTASSSGGTTSSVNGTCGSSNGGSDSTAPTANLCSAGTASSVSGSGPWSWSCAGSGGGTNATCSAKKVASAQPVNGACGSSNGGTVSTKPTANLCTAGTASTVSGSGPWSWSCAGANGGSTASCSDKLASTGSSGSTGADPTPILIQHVASSANPVGLGIPGNNYKIPLPNPVLAGDALVLAITYPHGNLITVSDSLRQTWPQASIVTDGGTGNYTTGIYVRCGSAGGSETITVGLSGSGLPFEYTVSEFNSVAASNCVDGTVGGANLSPSGSGGINPGSFTPLTNNNSIGGHIIWSYTAISSMAGGNPTSWSPAGGFKLLDGDIAWINDQGFPHASQWSIQSEQASVTPSVTATGDTADTFNSASVSLVVASAGGAAPSGIHINKIIHETWIALSSGAALRLQLPTTGNLRILTFPAGQNNIDITSITDSDDSAWSLAQTGGDSAQIWYAANRPANPGLIVTIHTSGTSPNNSARFFDVQGAATTPFDVSAGTDLTPCSSQTTIDNQPTITPTGANELVIATMGIGDGPGLAVASGAPTGAVWDLTTYSGELDMDLMENADALAHVYTTTATTEHWNWTITSNGDNSCSSEAVAFKPAG
jgi:hypothetical protein